MGICSMTGPIGSAIATYGFYLWQKNTYSSKKKKKKQVNLHVDPTMVNGRLHLCTSISAFCGEVMHPPASTINP